MQGKILKFGWFLILFLIGAQKAFACSCAGKPAVLDAFERSETVIIARVVGLDRMNENGEITLETNEMPKNATEDEKKNKSLFFSSEDSFRDYRSARMIVEKVYKGKVKTGEELIFAQGGSGDCIWTYDRRSIGDRYLLYLGEPSKSKPLLTELGIDKPEEDAPLMYYAFACGRSSGVESATEDLTYLDKIDKVRGKTRISGTLESDESYAPSFAEIPVKSSAKAKPISPRPIKTASSKSTICPPVSITSNRKFRSAGK